VEREALGRTVAGLPQAKWVIWAGVGHSPQLERPAKFNQLLLQFIENNNVIIENPVQEPVSTESGIVEWFKNIWKRFKP
jgi:hypothetical protein